MLKIRPEQMKVFQPTAELAFARRVVGHLRQRHARTAVRFSDRVVTVGEVPDETLLGMVLGGMARARAYGMKWETTLAGFVVIMFEAAPNFDAHPLVRRALTDKNVEPDLRIKRLWEVTSEQNWEAVRHDYDPSAWQLPTREEGS